jgi:hypothetical protein
MLQPQFKTSRRNVANLWFLKLIILPNNLQAQQYSMAQVLWPLI